MLEIRNLHASIDGKEILKGSTSSVGAGEVHAIMGPNGSGKSTLGDVLSGREGYEVTGGSVQFNGQDLLALAPRSARAPGCSSRSSTRWKSPASATSNSSRPRWTRCARTAARSALDAVHLHEARAREAARP